MKSGSFPHQMDLLDLKLLTKRMLLDVAKPQTYSHPFESHRLLIGSTCLELGECI